MIIIMIIHHAIINNVHTCISWRYDNVYMYKYASDRDKINVERILGHIFPHCCLCKYCTSLQTACVGVCKLLMCCSYWSLESLYRTHSPLTRQCISLNVSPSHFLPAVMEVIHKTVEHKNIILLS